MSREVAMIETCRHEGVHHACNAKSQQQIGRHLIDKVQYLLHYTSLFLFLRTKVLHSWLKDNRQMRSMSAFAIGLQSLSPIVLSPL